MYSPLRAGRSKPQMGLFIAQSAPIQGAVPIAVATIPDNENYVFIIFSNNGPAANTLNAQEAAIFCRDNEILTRKVDLLLTELTLSENAAKLVASFIANKYVNTIKIQNSKMSHNALAIITDALNAKRQIEDIWFEGIEFTDQDIINADTSIQKTIIIDNLTQLLTSIEKLEAVRFKNCGLDDTWPIENFASGTYNSELCIDLLLSNNKLGKGAATRLAHAMADPKSRIRNLFLDTNRIGHNVGLFAETIEINPHLNMLVLADNFQGPLSELQSKGEGEKEAWNKAWEAAYNKLYSAQIKNPITLLGITVSTLERREAYVMFAEQMVTPGNDNFSPKENEIRFHQRLNNLHKCITELNTLFANMCKKFSHGDVLQFINYYERGATSGFGVSRVKFNFSDLAEVILGPYDHNDTKDETRTKIEAFLTKLRAYFEIEVVRRSEDFASISITSVIKKPEERNTRRLH